MRRKEPYRVQRAADAARVKGPNRGGSKKKGGAFYRSCYLSTGGLIYIPLSWQDDWVKSDYVHTPPAVAGSFVLFLTDSQKDGTINCQWWFTTVGYKENEVVESN